MNKNDLTTARTTLILANPYWGILSAMFPLMESEEVETVTIDSSGDRILYNPVKRVSNEKLCDDLIKAIQHYIDNGEGSDHYERFLVTMKIAKRSTNKH